jgi:DNA-binding transcriptional MocR family regulator
MWKPRSVEEAPLKYLGIVEALEADIRRGSILPGERLPAQRTIAEALDVDLTTVTRAFNEARRRGLVAAQAGRGTFVRDDPDQSGLNQPSPLLDLSMNIPPQPASIDFRKLFSQTMSNVLSGPRGGLSLHYQESTGALADRQAGARWLSSRMDRIEYERITVAAGAQSALFALCTLLLSAGDCLAMGQLTYPGIKAVAAQQGLKVEPVAMDVGGLIPEDFERVCRLSAPKALYVVPSIDNPTAVTLSEARRSEIVVIARRFSVLLIEDDPYSALKTDRQAAFASLAPDLTWHIATLSKCVTPALRVAYVVAPDTTGAARLASVLRATTLMAPPVLSAVASRWIADGHLDAITKAIRAENHARQELAARAFVGQRLSADPEGHHLWLSLPDHWRAEDFADHAERAGVSIVPASAFAVKSKPAEAVRLSLGIAPDKAVLEEGLLQLAALIEQPQAQARTIV